MCSQLLKLGGYKEIRKGYKDSMSNIPIPNAYSDYKVQLELYSRAEKHRMKALQTFSRERWLDMGMSTITFTVHIDEQGRFIGDM